MMPVSDFQKAYNSWAATDPKDCACRGTPVHFIKDIIKGKEVYQRMGDEEICERERRWRIYCDLRDGQVKNVS